MFKIQGNKIRDIINNNKSKLIPLSISLPLQLSKSKSFNYTIFKSYGFSFNRNELINNLDLTYIKNTSKQIINKKIK